MTTTRRRVLNQLVKLNRDYNVLKKDDICYVIEKPWSYDNEYRVILIKSGSKEKFGQNIIVPRRVFDVIEDAELKEYEVELIEDHSPYKKGSAGVITKILSSSKINVDMTYPIYLDGKLSVKDNNLITLPFAKLKLIETEVVEDDAEYICAKMPWEI